ncbi:MAG: bifunctional (p)ppGpp synthetase/guanosine-3',5'-bis(diphosphate) 3'-pyrophosphohydrolase [Proteobacteria bacterium]|nr:bifunctional (p)ppGpp synthetase/guanosine-3',5'-bis(diphosphate) 3'-pyrophosphohydrolase [Pseudomonadota bacterium]
MLRQFELLEKIKSYDPQANEDMINRAYVFAMKAHGSQKRASGDPYFSHPIEVAGILTRYKVDTATIVTALLHDTIEDTAATYDEISKQFNEEIARLVDGVTKLTRISFVSDQAKQAENFRKFLLAMSEDIRVLLVKLADRLHNMQTLKHVKKAETRQRIALETMEIYAPLAERIGMGEIKNELEDLAFAELNPDARKSVVRRLDFLRQHGEGLVERIIDGLRKLSAKSGIEAEIHGREKTAHSIWQKMQRNDVGFEQLADIMAFRIIVGSIDDCYRMLGVIHGAYRTVPGRFKDYISTPKPNGYRSLHTGVFGPENHRIELQIRTQEMHEIAENGVAAHWNYKDGGRPDAARQDGPQYRWLRELLEILETAPNPEEFLEHTKLEMFKDQVFCFTPRGDLINLPRGATPVDFAYAVHSEIGDSCVGAKINGRMMPLRTELRNGDQVEVITSKAQTPSPTWDRFVVTGKARAHIRRFVRTQERDQYHSLGRSMLQRAFKETGYEFTEKGLSGVLKTFSQPSVEDLAAQVGAGHITARAVAEAVYPGLKNQPRNDKVVPLGKSRGTAKAGSAGAIPIKGLIPGMAMHFPNCCHPLPGDRIVGIVTTGRGVTIHTIDCDKLEQYNNEPERWLDVGWDNNAGDGGSRVGRVAVTVANTPGSLGDLSTIIAKNGGNITNLKITDRQLDFFDMLIDIEVKNVKHLADIIAALRASTAINTVDRARG